MSKTDEQDLPVMNKRSSKNKKVDSDQETRRYGEMTWKEMIWKSRSKIKLSIAAILIGAGLILCFKYIGWIIPVTISLAIAPLFLFLKGIISIPRRLVMEYKRKLKHFNLYSIPTKMFRHFDIDPRISKLTAGSNQFVFLCSEADLENYNLKTSWASTANPFDFMVDEDAYMELAIRYEKMAEQDIANIAIPQSIGYDYARKNSEKLDEHDFDDLPEDYSNLKKDRPTEAYDNLKEMKKVGRGDG